MGRFWRTQFICIAMAALGLAGCLEQAEKCKDCLFGSDIDYSKAIACEDLDASIHAEIQNLESIVLDPNTTSAITPYLRTQTLQELGRIGCESSRLVFATMADQPGNSDAINHEKAAGSLNLEILNSPSRALSSPIVRFNYFQNPGVVGSSNFLLPDGSRTGFMSTDDYDEIEADWMSLPPDSPHLAQMLIEPPYLDGHDGFWLQKLAISRYDSGDPYLTTKALIDSLQIRLRGFPAAESLMSRVFYFSTHDTSDARVIDLLKPLIDKNDNLHPDERIRSMVIEGLGLFCDTTTQQLKSVCKDEVYPLVLDRMKHDPMLQVRATALYALATRGLPR